MRQKKFNRVKQFAWSISALKSYETCPKKHAQVKVYKKFKEDFGSAAEYGKYVHSGLELYVKKGKPLPLDIRHLERYVEPYRAAAQVEGVEVLTEQQLTLNPDYELTGWFDNDAWCRAIADVVIQGEKAVTIVDYKTNARVQDDGFEQLRLLAAIYSIAQPAVETYNLAYQWMKHKGKKSTLTQSRDEVREVWAELLPRVELMEAAIKAEDFPARPSGLCRKHCPVTTCPHHGV